MDHEWLVGWNDVDRYSALAALVRDGSGHGPPILAAPSSHSSTSTSQGDTMYQGYSKLPTLLTSRNRHEYTF
jgi:hypothetical protein